MPFMTLGAFYSFTCLSLSNVWSFGLFVGAGISILFQKPKKQPPSTFSFMSPFSTGVWMSLGGAYLTVSILLFVIGRLSPNEWDNPYPCVEQPTQLENQFSIANAMWFCIGALLQQGSEIAPKYLAE